MARYFECRINKCALLQTFFFGDFAHWEEILEIGIPLFFSAGYRPCESCDLTTSNCLIYTKSEIIIRKSGKIWGNYQHRKIGTESALVLQGVINKL